MTNIFKKTTNSSSSSPALVLETRKTEHYSRHDREGKKTKNSQRSDIFPRNQRHPPTRTAIIDTLHTKYSESSKDRHKWKLDR